MQLFLGFMVALSITAALIPLLARWAPAIGLTDRPNARKVHGAPVPRVGGIAMAAGIGVPALLSLELDPALAGLLAGCAILLAFGVWDDRAELGYRVKFAGQILAVVTCMAVGGVGIESVTIGVREPLPSWLGAAVTFVFLLGVTNAVNLADGLDGLAGGVALLCCGALGLLAAVGGQELVAAVALIEAGAILGFLRFNTHPARVFMGDGGSQVLGFSLGVLAVLATQGEQVAVSAALPLLLLGVPILDTLTVMVVRMRAGRSPFTSDRNHLHHKLLGFGFAHHEAVTVIYCLQGVLFVLAYALRFESDLVIAAVFVAFAAFVLGAQRLAWRCGWRLRDAQARSGRQDLLARTRDALLAAGASRSSAWITAAGLLAYATAVVATAEQVRSDVAILCLVMLSAVAALGLSGRAGAMQWLERAVAYVTVTLIVYLDETNAGVSANLERLLWAVLGATAAAAVLRFWLLPRRGFEVTALDVLVIFLALVVPNLPGVVSLPANLVAGVSKAVILLYVVEMLLGNESPRTLPRALLVALLGAVALRALPALSA